MTWEVLPPLPTGDVPFTLFGRTPLGCCSWGAHGGGGVGYLGSGRPEFVREEGEGRGGLEAAM